MKDLTSCLLNEIEKGLIQLNECNWSDKEFYGDYLAQTFYYVRHSTRLLALSASRLNYEKEQAIHLRFIKHLAEESNHEKLVLNDLKNLGYAKEDFSELQTTRLFYEPQYYKIEHIRPLALMGYILYLEALAQKSCPILAKKVSESHGARSATFLRVHGEEDPKHVAEAIKLTSALERADLLVIEENLVQSSYAFKQLLNEIKSKAQKSSLKIAA